MAGRANARAVVSSRLVAIDFAVFTPPLPSHFSPAPAFPIEFHRIEIKIISLDRGQSDNDFDVNARATRSALSVHLLCILT